MPHIYNHFLLSFTVRSSLGVSADNPLIVGAHTKALLTRAALGKGGVLSPVVLEGATGVGRVPDDLRPKTSNGGSFV